MSDSLLVLRDLGIKHRHKHNTDLTGFLKSTMKIVSIFVMLTEGKPIIIGVEN